MATIKLKKLKSDNVEISVHVILEQGSGRGYENTIELCDSGDGWVCNLNFNDMPPQKSFEDAIDRMRLYLDKYSKALKSSNFKHLNPDKLFEAKYTK